MRLELVGFNDSRWTVSQRLGLTSASMLPAALLWAEYTACKSLAEVIVQLTAEYEARPEPDA